MFTKSKILALVTAVVSFAARPAAAVIAEGPYSILPNFDLGDGVGVFAGSLLDPEAITAIQGMPGGVSPFPHARSLSCSYLYLC